MSVGAPAALLDEALVAARDEIRHATLAYGLASAFGGDAVGPGPFETLGNLGVRTVTLSSLASECFIDGCIGETVAALGASEARMRATPKAVRDALDVIVTDEARHAEFAYRIVAWALAEGGAPVRAQLESDLAVVRNELTCAPSPSSPAPANFDERLGVLSFHTAGVVRRRVLTDIVVPSTTALLAQERPPRGARGIPTVADA